MSIKKLFDNTTKMKLTKKHWIYSIVTIGFLVQIYLSLSLWYGESREFFLVPMFDNLPLNIGNIGDMTLFIALLVSLIMGVFYHKKYLLGSVLLFMILLFLQDLTRVQAWSYQYFLTFAVLFIDWKKPNKILIPTLQLILIFTYFWSGIQKLNPHYVANVHPFLFTTFDWLEPFGNNPKFGYVSAVFELLIGLGLYFRKTQRITLILAIGMHLSILVIIGPLGLDWNEIVYPWNFVMIFSLPILFWNTTKTKEVETEKNPFLYLGSRVLIILIIGILPVFNLFTRFPETISMTMYNGATSEISVYYQGDEIPNCIPKVTQEDIYPTRLGNQISLDDWGIDELNVPVYDLPTYARKFGKQFCDCLENKEIAGVRITNMKRWQTKDYMMTEKIDCSDL
jgi:hypothetical protein